MAGLRRDSFGFQRELLQRGSSNIRMVYGCSICKIVICRAATRTCPNTSSTAGDHRLSKDARYMSLTEATELRDKARGESA